MRILTYFGHLPPLKKSTHIFIHTCTHTTHTCMHAYTQIPHTYSHTLLTYFGQLPLQVCFPDHHTCDVCMYIRMLSMHVCAFHCFPIRHTCDVCMHACIHACCMYVCMCISSIPYTHTHTRTIHIMYVCVHVRICMPVHLMRTSQQRWRKFAAILFLCLFDQCVYVLPIDVCITCNKPLNEVAQVFRILFLCLFDHSVGFLAYQYGADPHLSRLGAVPLQRNGGCRSSFCICAVCMCVCVCVCVCVHAICMCVRMHVCVCMYVYVCMYVFVYIYIYIHTHTDTCSS